MNESGKGVKELYLQGLLWTSARPRWAELLPDSFSATDLT